MALNSGARLDPYEIVGPLGAGGMGELKSPSITIEMNWLSLLRSHAP